MKTISFKLVGVSPLMLNNPRTVSPFDDYAKAISSLTSKRRKTEEDQLISHKWLKEKFGLPKLSFENYDKNVDAYIEAIQLQQFTYMEMVDKLREDLLKNKQCCLRNDWGKGYKIVPSNKQANYGYEQMMGDIKKALKQGSDIINNVRPLPMEEQSKYYDTLAKLAKVRDVFANFK